MEEKKNGKTLLIGNGFNRAFDQDSWSDLIQSIAKNHNNEDKLETIMKLPYPMQIVASSNDSVDKEMKEYGENMAHFKICEDQKTMMKEVLALPIDAILTTNYTYELEQSVLGQYSSGDYRKYRKLTKEVNRSEKRSMLYQYTEINNQDISYPRIWHIHGEAHYPDSMVIGHYYYGKLLNGIQNYTSSLIRNIKTAESENREYDYSSWIDYFVLNDVHVVGFGMDPAEEDLWWLLCYKKRNFSDRKTTLLIPEKDISSEKELLLKAYGVEIIKIPLINSDYRSWYKQATLLVKNKI